MLKRVLTCAAATLAMSLGVSAVARAAQPVVITFDDHVTETEEGDGTTQGGMNFVGYQFWFLPPDFVMANPSTFPSHIDTPVMATWIEPAVMSLVGGGAFDLLSLDTALGWYNVSESPDFTDTETVTGHKAGCVGDDCTVTAQFQVGYQFDHHVLGGFTGLDSVTFGALTQQFIAQPGEDVIPYSGFIGFDNITYAADTGGPVPEPAQWALMIAGFGAVGGMLRRRRGLALQA